jgi:uncharacterized membrane protein
MEELFRILAANVALAVETVAIAIITFGALEALLGTLAPLVRRSRTVGWRKRVWVRLGSWLLLGLQFALAADIVRSTISPDWTDIGQLAAIAAIRTFLNYFLERDLAEFTAESRAVGAVEEAVTLDGRR